jgi:hypothetical protein
MASFTVVFVKPNNDSFASERSQIAMWFHPAASDSGKLTELTIKGEF